MVTEDSVELLFTVIRDFYQGETIFELPVIPGYYIDYPNSVKDVAVRNGKIVAFRCIKSGEEIMVKYKITEREQNGC